MRTLPNSKHDLPAAGTLIGAEDVNYESFLTGMATSTVKPLRPVIPKRWIGALSVSAFVARTRGIGPRSPPPHIARQGFGHRIEPGGAPRVAAEKPSNAHRAPCPNPVPRDRLVHIGRAGWQMPAMGPGDRRQRKLIGAYHKMCAETADRRQNLHLACRQALHFSGPLWQKYTGAPSNDSS
jgi:hypothetical protein